MPTAKQLERELADAHARRRRDATRKRQENELLHPRSVYVPPSIIAEINGRSLVLSPELADAIYSSAYSDVDWDDGPSVKEMVEAVLLHLERSGVVLITPLAVDA